MYKSKIITVLAALTLLGSSCGLDWMQIEPTDGLIAQRYWQSKEDVMLAVIGCYQAVIGTGTSPSGTDPLELFFAWGELRADMVTMGDVEDEDIKNLTYGKMETTNRYCNWASVYKAINFCNEVIDRAPAVREVDPSFTATELNQLLAEARGIRAMLYFYLTRAFGDIPVRTAPSQTDNQEFNIPAYSEEFAINFIIDELEWVKANAVRTFENEIYDRARITRNVASAMLADVYLWNGDNDQCIQEVNSLIQSGKYALFDLPRTLVNDATSDSEKRYRIDGGTGAMQQWFQDLYVSNSSSEIIFGLIIGEDRQHPFAYSSAKLSMQPEKAIKASDMVAQEHALFGIENDESMYDVRGPYCSFNNAKSEAIWKYIGADRNNTRASSQGGSFYLYRYADVLLLKAEAIATKQGPSQAELEDALAIVNDIRTRRNAYCSTYQEVRVNGQIEPGALESYILEERARELAYEGKRFFDLFRYARRSEGNRSEVAGILSAVASVDYAQEIATLYQNIGAYYWPIFQDEIEANEALVQNPYYIK